MSDNRVMLPVRWYELADWNADPPRRYEEDDLHAIAVEYTDPSHDSWVTVVTLLKRPGQADPSGGGGTLPTSMDDARGWAIGGALSAFSHDLPHHAHAIAADTGRYFLAIGSRNTQPEDLAVLLAG